MIRYNFGVIGNRSYPAYIDTKANVNWLCLPRFDSSFIFGSLLDIKKGGEFSIMPENLKNKPVRVENNAVYHTQKRGCRRELWSVGQLSSDL